MNRKSRHQRNRLTGLFLAVWWSGRAVEAFWVVRPRPTVPAAAAVSQQPQPIFFTTITTATSTTRIHSKKKKVVAPAAAKKIQVKMLKSVPGTGQKGDVVFVTPAFFNNKLRPTASAAVISDEQVSQEKAQQEAAELERNTLATELKEYLEANPLRLQRKAGPDGQLFGSINGKAVLAALVAEQVVDAQHAGYLEQKNVKIVAIVDGRDGQKISGDIKHVGEFQATISLTQTLSAELAVIVDAEK